MRLLCGLYKLTWVQCLKKCLPQQRNSESVSYGDDDDGGGGQSVGGVAINLTMINAEVFNLHFLTL